MQVKLTPQHVEAIERVLNAGKRVELVPVKNGVKVVRVRREEVKNQN